MAFPIFSILRAVAPLASRAGDIMSTYVGMQTQRATMALEEHVRRIEEESLRATEVLRSTTEQLLLLAEHVRILQRRMMWCMIIAIAAVALAITALIVRV